MVGSLVDTVADSMPVNKLPSTAGNLALPSRTTSLLAAVPVSNLALAIVPEPILLALVVSVVAEVASPVILEVAIAASDLISTLVIVFAAKSAATIVPSSTFAALIALSVINSLYIIFNAICFP